MSRFVLRRDGKEVARGSEGDLWRLLHSTHGYSVDHALKHEGYSIKPEQWEVRGKGGLELEGVFPTEAGAQRYAAHLSSEFGESFVVCPEKARP